MRTTWAANRWRSFARRAVGLAFKRHVWAIYGNWLKEIREQGKVVHWWRKGTWDTLVRSLLRLAFKRRCWGLLGGWLQRVKRGVRAVDQ